jgi:hypothetical protein
MKLALLLALSVFVAACDKDKDSAKKDDDKSSSASKKKKGKNPTAEFDGDEAGAKKLLKHLMDEDTDRAEITEALKPQDDDYAAVFKDDAAAEAKKGYKKLFDKFAGSKIEPKAGQTELKLFSASTEDLKTSDDFPGGYKKVAGKIKKGLTFYAWKFVKPGESSGMAYDGLVYVNDHWAWFPKPWMALAEE